MITTITTAMSKYLTHEGRLLNIPVVEGVAEAGFEVVGALKSDDILLNTGFNSVRNDDPKFANSPVIFIT